MLSVSGGRGEGEVMSVLLLLRALCVCVGRGCVTMRFAYLYCLFYDRQHRFQNERGVF